MVTPMRRLFPAWFLAAGSPLTRHPPTSDFLGARRIFEIDDRNDVPEIALHFRRAVNITSVEREPVHAARAPGCDMARRRWLGDIENLEAALEIWILSADWKNFAIDQHDAVVDANLVRKGAVRDFDLGKLARFCRIADVDKRGAVRRKNMPYIGDSIPHDDLPTAGTVEITDNFQTFCNGHLRILCPHTNI